MKKWIATAMGVILSMSIFTACKDDTTLDVYLIGGQSNAVGNAYLIDLDEKERNVTYADTLYYAEGTVDEYGVLTSVTTEDEKGLGWRHEHFGAEVGMAKAFAGEKGKRAIIKCAYNGSSINKNNTGMGSWWTETAEIPNVSIKCYDGFIQAVINGLKALKEDGYTPKIKGMVWLQGESNAGNSTYLNDLRNLRDKIRNVLGVPDMYFLAGEISNTKYGEACAVNQAVHTFAEDEHCDYVACGALPLDTRTNNSYHWTGGDMLQIGLLCGEKLLQNT